MFPAIFVAMTKATAFTASAIPVNTQTTTGDDWVSAPTYRKPEITQRTMFAKNAATPAPKSSLGIPVADYPSGL